MKTVNAYRIKVVSGFAFATAALVFTSAIAIGVSVTGRPVPVLGDLGIGAESRADHAVQSGMASAEALRVNEAALAAAPMNAAAWLRIAYIHSLDGASLNASALGAVQKSYSVAPYGPDVTRWRLQFLYDHWGQLNAELRAEAMDEHLAYGRQIRLSPSASSDQAGWLASSLMNKAVRAARVADLAVSAK